MGYFFVKKDECVPFNYLLELEWIRNIVQIDIAKCFPKC